jgi:cyclophilin family peptidyl-prolyl cis-trans isomerase
MPRTKAVHVLLACVLVGACALTGTDEASTSRTAFSEVVLDDLERPALLLLMADQLLFEPFAVRTIFRENPGLHEQLAVTLGRVGDARGVPYLESLLVDPVVEVRRAAAFGLGQLGDRTSYPALLGALGDRDREVGRLAVGALARMGSPLVKIEAALGVVTQVETLHRILPSLFRFDPGEIHRVALDLDSGSGLATGIDSGLGRWLLYALARSGDARGLPWLRSALDHQDHLARLHSLLESEDSGVVVQTLRAASSLLDTGRAAPPDSWLADLEVLIEDDRAWVRMAAIEVAGSWIQSPELGGRLRVLASADRGRVAELALVSLAHAGDVESEQLIHRAAASRWPAMRRAAARAAGIAGLNQIIDRLRADPKPPVRMAALTAVFEGASPSESLDGTRVALAAREALLDPDPGIRAVALEWLSSNAIAPLDELMLALSGAAEHRLPELQVNGAAALAARASDQPLERGASVAALERLAENSNYLVRRAAGDALVSLGRERPPLGTITSTRSLRAYRAMAGTLEKGPLVELMTERGEIVIRLEPRIAPLTCISFLQLVEAGFFTGLEFHRVIPDFVAQGGDPRGDGWGGPGFSLRDENSRIPFERGVIGMARSETHTAGSQFFLTMSEQPHLNGSYTAFGRVVGGEEWLNSIEQGDAILSIRELPAPYGKLVP